MRQLKHVTVDGLKNLREFDLETPQFLALAGPNGSGKTAVLQAIRIGVLGHAPEIGRTLSATRQLKAESLDAFDLSLVFSDGFSIRRTVGASMELEITPPEGESTLADKQARIEEEVGVFVPSFDLGAFLDLSSEKRKEYLFGLLPRDLADLDEDVFRRWLGYSEAGAVVQKAIDVLWHDHVTEESSPIDGLASAIEFAHDRYLEAERARQAQVKVTEAAEADAIEASEGVDEDPEALDVLQAELDVVTRRLGELEALGEERERAERRARERQHQIRVVEMKLEEVAEASRAAEEAVAELERPDPDLAEQLEREAVDVEAKVSSLEQEIHDLRVERSQMKSDLDSLEDRLQGYRDRLDTCPTCGQDMPEPDKDLASADEVRVDKLTARLGENIEPALDAKKADLAEVREIVASKRAAAEEVRERIRTYDRLTDRLQAKTHEQQSLRDERQRLDDLEVEIPEAPDANEKAELTAKASSIREQVREDCAKPRLVGKAEDAHERAPAERKNLDKKTRRADALKGLHAGLQKLRAHVIEQMVGPVEETANGLLQAIDSEKMFRFVFEREGRAEFDLGFEEDGVFRSYDAASTGEDAFLAVVLVAALISACGPAWSVLLVDNIEGVDDRRRRDLMEALTSLSERIGNVIVAGCCSFEAIEGWAIQDMEEQAEIRKEVLA